MDLETVEKLVDLVAAANVREVTVRDGAMRVTVRKAPRPQRRDEAPRAVGQPAPARHDRYEEPADQPEGPPAITSPMVGIYHPATPAIQPGWSVKIGQVVGVVESMKLLSDVRADRAGVVRAALVEQGMAVEFGQPLFELEPEDDG